MDITNSKKNENLAQHQKKTLKNYTKNLERWVPSIRLGLSWAPLQVTTERIFQVAKTKVTNLGEEKHQP